VENLTVEEVRRAFAGESSNWRRFGGRDESIVPVVQPVGSDMTAFFVQQVMAGEPIRARAITAGSDSEVVETVARTRGAIGFVSLAWADRGARALRIASLRGLPYWKPDLEQVYRGQYPLTRFFNLYVRAAGAKLANGLITFVTSIDGQRIVQQAGYVPTAVPVRFVRRSPLLGTH
jgi:phosphate transport system substrate-binding protein